MVGDFDQDGLDDLIFFDPARGLVTQWSSLDDAGANRLIHRFGAEISSPVVIGGLTKMLAANVDLSGPPDLVLVEPGARTLTVLPAPSACRDAASCFGAPWSVPVPDPTHDIGATAVGNFDGAFGDDVLLTVHGRTATTATILWSDGRGGLVSSRSVV